MVNDAGVLKNSHMKFFKSPRNFNVEAGDYFKNFVVNESGLKMYDLIKREHLLAIFLSIDCPTCEDSLHIIDSYSLKKPDVNIAVFINADDVTTQLLNDYYKGRIFISSVGKERMKDELQVFSFPRGFMLNKYGQVLRSEVCGADFAMDMLLMPLRKLSI
ncbi:MULTISPECIES: hypothetical protein [Paenibacillus]|uniref:AhpC/TSA family protein n=2 Tax=Paenibacillus TaxID=44249 RepID=A0A855XX06_9BACL|nr:MULTISPECIES: hypothetical protein [Paenibacillus]PWW42293.1 hypothetical protein DET56_104352 [Paenibacillus pabuli]PXW07681.1 hypothetical protein DEU73_105351 [Paenibacillus taichungensis]RAI94554.1 hypothetical protein DET54_10789 [Paenibacillus pabuli]